LPARCLNTGLVSNTSLVTGPGCRRL